MKNPIAGCVALIAVCVISIPWLALLLYTLAEKGSRKESRMLMREKLLVGLSFLMMAMWLVIAVSNNAAIAR